MKPSSVISLDRPKRLLKKTETYLADMDVFLADSARAVKTLLDVVPYADQPLLFKILPLLGSSGKETVLWPLFHLMMDSSMSEEIRRFAAVQLGLAASLSQNPAQFNTALIDNLDHPVSLIRICCALAIGWEENHAAVPALIGRLQDADREVQTAVVTALSSIGDAKVFDALRERLIGGSPEEQRSIILNLWRFAERLPIVEAVYLKCLDHLSTELVPDILSALAMIPHTPAILSVYRRVLAQDDRRIRLQVLENIEALDPAEYEMLSETLHDLLSDDDSRVRQAAIRLLNRG
jgi:HEAT repeat protein